MLVVFVVPPPPASPIQLNPSAISIKLLFGTGINLVGFFVLLLFGFALITSLSSIRTNFLYSPQAKLLHSSPHSLRQLLAGEILSSTIYREYGISMMLVSFYFVYRIWVNLPLSVIDIFVLILFGVILSLTGNFFGIIIGILTLGDWKDVFFSKSFLFVITTIFVSVITLTVDFLIQQSLFQPFSPLGWITLGIYSLFSGNNPEFHLTIFLAGSILFIGAIMVPRRLSSESLQLKDKIFDRKPGFFQKLLTGLVCGLYRGEYRNLAEIMLLEEWEKKRPLKYLAMAAVVVFFFLLFQTISSRNLLIEFVTLIPLGTFLFCLIAPISRTIYQDFSYSLFNIDGRFLFYRSTSSGVSKIAKMRLSLILLWETPLIVITSIVAALINPNVHFIIWFSLAFSAVLLITCTDLLILCLRPRYHLSSFFQIEEQVLLMILVLTIVLLLTAISSSIVLGIPEALVAMILTIIAICTSIIGVQQGLKKLENEESLH
jgi:hypothetical protein